MKTIRTEIEKELNDMKDKYQLSIREQSVMDLLWDEGEALTSVDILERLGDIMQNATYVHRTINS